MKINLYNYTQILNKIITESFFFLCLLRRRNFGEALPLVESDWLLTRRASQPLTSSGRLHFFCARSIRSSLVARFSSTSSGCCCSALHPLKQDRKKKKSLPLSWMLVFWWVRRYGRAMPNSAPSATANTPNPGRTSPSELLDPHFCYFMFFSPSDLILQDPLHPWDT